MIDIFTGVLISLNQALAMLGLFDRDTNTLIYSGVMLLGIIAFLLLTREAA